MFGPLRSLDEDPVQGAFGRPLSDPMWRRWFDRLKEMGVDKLSAGSSAPGSNQLRGFSVQPDYFSGGATFQGRLNKGYKPTAGPGQEGIVEGMIPSMEGIQDATDPNGPEARQKRYVQRQAGRGRAR